MDTIYISIAEFLIEVIPENGHSLKIELGWRDFVKDKPSGIIDMQIHSRAGIPENLKEMGKPVFEAENETQRFFSVYQSGNNLKFIIYSQDNQEVIQQIALCNKTFTKWEVYSHPLKGNRLIPLQYPLGPLLLYYLTVGNQAIMVHSSGVFDGEKGRLFTGFSGMGKSTISSIWARANNYLLNDDRLIIRRINHSYFMYNTPMFYQDCPKKAPLHSIFLISHSQQNQIKRIDGAYAVTRVLAHCIQNNYDRNYISNHLNFLSDLCKRVKVYELGFVPNDSIVDFIRNSESE